MESIYLYLARKASNELILDSLKQKPIDIPVAETSLKNVTSRHNLYAILPTSLDKITAGLHPLTLPGVQVPYYNNSYYAIHDALHNDYNEMGPQISVICQVKNTRKLHPVDPACLHIGTATLNRQDVLQECLVVSDASKQSTYAVNTTNLNAQQYAALAHIIKEGANKDVVQQCINAMREKDVTQIQPHIKNLLNKAEDIMIENATQAYFPNLVYASQSKQVGLQELVKIANECSPNQEVAMQAAETLWKQISTSISDKMQARYGEFRDTVMKAAERGSVRQALEEGCKMLASKSTYMERVAIKNALNSVELKVAVESQYAQTPENYLVDSINISETSDVHDYFDSHEEECLCDEDELE